MNFSFRLNPKWVLAALRTVTRDNRNLRWFSFELSSQLPHTPDSSPYGPTDPKRAAEEAIVKDYFELDRHLLELNELSPISVVVVSPVTRGRLGMKDLLPGLVELGVARLYCPPRLRLPVANKVRHFNSNSDSGSGGSSSFSDSDAGEVDSEGEAME